MSKVKVSAFTVSIDGFGAGPGQDLKNPLGIRGIESALKQARDAAQGKDIRISGGVSVIQQYLKAGLIDEMHLVVSPVLLGRGENLFSGVDLSQLGFVCSEHIATADALHVVLRKSSNDRNTQGG